MNKLLFEDDIKNGETLLGFLELRVHPLMKQQVIRTLFIIVLTLIFESRCLFTKVLSDRNPRVVCWPAKKTLGVPPSPPAVCLPPPSRGRPPAWHTGMRNLSDKKFWPLDPFMKLKSMLMASPRK